MTSFDGRLLKAKTCAITYLSMQKNVSWRINKYDLEFWFCIRIKLKIKKDEWVKLNEIHHYFIIYIFKWMHASLFSNGCDRLR